MPRSALILPRSCRYHDTSFKVLSSKYYFYIYGARHLMNLSTTTTDAAQIANLPASLADFDEGEGPMGTLSREGNRR